MALRPHPRTPNCRPEKDWQPPHLDTTQPTPICTPGPTTRAQQTDRQRDPPTGPPAETTRRDRQTGPPDRPPDEALHGDSKNLAVPSGGPRQVLRVMGPGWESGRQNLSQIFRVGSQRGKKTNARNDLRSQNRSSPHKATVLSLDSIANFAAAH